MSPRWVVLVVAGLALLAVPAAAHGNYVSVDPQVSTDGTVRIEFGVLVTDGFVVLHADADGEPGASVGHRAFESYIHADLEVAIDPAYWANQSGAVDLWAVMHRDDGDGRFEPEDDPPLRTASDDRLVADRFVVRKAETGPFNVAAERDQGQETDRNEVTLRAVRLGTDGYVVIRADADGAPGRVVGRQALPAGEHLGVTVTVDEAFYERRPEAFALWAVVHTSDGDGVFNVSDDPAVTAGDVRVMTRFFVHRTDPIEHTPTPRATATTTASTPTPTADHGGHDHDHTATTTTAGSHDDSATTGGTSHDHDDHDHDSPAPTAGPGQPGFGPVAAVLGVVAATLLASRRD